MVWNPLPMIVYHVEWLKNKEDLVKKKLSDSIRQWTFIVWGVDAPEIKPAILEDKQGKQIHVHLNIYFKLYLKHIKIRKKIFKNFNIIRCANVKEITWLVNSFICVLLLNVSLSFNLLIISFI